MKTKAINARKENKYEEIKREVSKPANDRATIKSKSNMVKPRRYSLSNNALTILVSQYKCNKTLPNPYRKKGIYHSLVQALINLGVNDSHTFVSVKNEIQKIMSLIPSGDSNAWEEFVNKGINTSSLRKTNCNWDHNKRIEETVKILQRLGGYHPYGYKLAQLHACIDILPSTDPLLPNKFNIRLNTKFRRRKDVNPLCLSS